MVALCACLVAGPLQTLSEPWEMVEYFSGTGRISRLAAKTGIACASYELLLGSANPNPNENGKKSRRFPKRSCMDFNGECGFSPLESFRNVIFVGFGDLA